MERYIVMRILLALFLLFVVIFFIVRLAGGGDDAPVTEDVAGIQEEVPFILSEQNNPDSTVRFTIVGKTNAPEDHREIRFTITQTARRAEILKGYDGEVIKTLSLPNTPSSYQEFLYAIEAEGYTLERSEPTITDVRGQCSDGKKYLYTSRLNGVVTTDLWSVSCSRKPGTFGGDRNGIVKLFERQFPDFNDFDRGVRL